MSRVKTSFVCSECGVASPKWAGQCADCGAWNSLSEEAVMKSSAPVELPARFAQTWVLNNTMDPVKLSAVPLSEEDRIDTPFSELNRVLGGGLVSGSVILLGGDPGIGKSTLLLQASCALASQYKTLYVSGEESLQQVAVRSKRMALPQDDMGLLAENQIERILSIAARDKPEILIIDSIQTVYTTLVQSAPGGVSQVRESASQLVQFAKRTGTILFLVGHVTKEGSLAGPRVLEHMVDTVLYFEGDQDSRYRVIRAVKNRFGPVNELGVFAMCDKGLREVSNPSAIFLSRSEVAIPGSLVMATWEGSRPILVEVQALVDETHLANPRRLALGLEANRLAMLLAVLHRHGGVATYGQDVFVNVVGGLKISETGADLALLLAICSSLRNKPLPADLIVFGEVGLAGEIRPVQSGQERLKEAMKHGFKHAIIPAANAPKGKLSGMHVDAVATLQDALGVLWG